MDAIDANNNVLPVSLWMKKMESSSDKDIRCIAVIEPVERVTAAVLFDSEVGGSHKMIQQEY